MQTTAMAPPVLITYGPSFRRSSRLALPLRDMNIAGRGAREFGTTDRTRRLGHHAGSLTLVP